MPEADGERGPEEGERHARVAPDHLVENQRILPGSEVGARLGFTTDVYQSGVLVRTGRVVWLRDLAQNAHQPVTFDRIFALGTAIIDLGYIFVLDAKGMDGVYRAFVQRHYLNHGGYDLLYEPAAGADPEWLILLLPSTSAGTPLHQALEYLKALDTEEERLWGALSYLESLHKTVVDEYQESFPDAGLCAMAESTEFHFTSLLSHLAVQQRLAKDLALNALKMESQKCREPLSDH